MALLRLLLSSLKENFGRENVAQNGDSLFHLTDVGLLIFFFKFLRETVTTCSIQIQAVSVNLLMGECCLFVAECHGKCSLNIKFMNSP